MFCSKCGNELKNNDKFCSKCGTKIKDNTSNQSRNLNKLSSLNPKLRIIIKFFAYFMIFILIVLLSYIIFPLKNASLSKFIMDPHGFSAVISQDMGGAIAMLLFILPLLVGLKKFEIINKTYKMEMFFTFCIVHNLGNLLLGEKFIEKISFPFLISAILGIIMIIISFFKKKK